VRIIFARMLFEPSIVRRKVIFEPVRARNAQESQTQLDKNEGRINVVIQKPLEGIAIKAKGGKVHSPLKNPSTLSQSI